MKDLIDRQAAVDVFQRLAYDDWNQGASTTWATAFAEGAEIIRGLPSAQPEQKTGRWLPIPDSYSFFYTIPICSECGCTTLMRTKTPFCPNCGAKMEDGDE